MAKMTKKQAKSLYEASEASKNFKSVFEHYEQSGNDLVTPQAAGWTEKEAILIGKNLDSITGQETHSGVFDNRLATILLERCGRVMAQNHSGKSLAMSNNDRGKNMLMNLLQDKWVLPNANSQFSFLIKSRLWDMYSQVYGVMFALTDRIETDTYQGPDYWLLPIRHCRPQPGRFSLASSDHFGVSTWVTPQWLKSRNRDTWKNVDELLLKMKDSSSKPAGENDTQERTFIEQERQPSTSRSKDFKEIEIYTEYRKDRWITIVPGFEDEKMVLRDIENPHGDDKLPIVAKYCWPLMDSIYGLGEFERGKTLQYALNSLWNLYLDGVKMSIFPPIQMVADDVVLSSILMEPAAKWLKTKQGSVIETFNASPQGINTFQNTYQYLIAAIQSQAGTSDTTVSSSTDASMGKTPKALALQANRENSRDAWDRFMMEEALQELMLKFVNLTANGLDKNVELRLFEDEIKEIAKVYPDVVEMTEGDERGKVTISKKEFEGVKFDYQITKGSTYKADQEQEQQNLTAILDFTIKNYELLETQAREKGKTVDVFELYQRSLVVAGTQDWDKIIHDLSPEQIQQMQMQQQAMQAQQQQAEAMQQGQMQGNEMLTQIQGMIKGGQPPGAMEAQAAQQLNQQMPQDPMQQQVQQPQSGPLSGQFSDPQIAEFAAQVMGGVNGQ